MHSRSLSLLVSDDEQAGGINGKQIELVWKTTRAIRARPPSPPEAGLRREVMAVIGHAVSAVTELPRTSSASEIHADRHDSTSVPAERKKRASPRSTACPAMTNTSAWPAGHCRQGTKRSPSCDNSSYAKGLAEEAQKGLRTRACLWCSYDAPDPGRRDYRHPHQAEGRRSTIFFTGYYPEAGMLLPPEKKNALGRAMMGGDAASNTDLVKIAGRMPPRLFLHQPAVRPTTSIPPKPRISSPLQGAVQQPAGSVWSISGRRRLQRSSSRRSRRDGCQSGKTVAKYLRRRISREYPGLTGKLGFSERATASATFTRSLQKWTATASSCFRSKVFGSGEDAFREPQVSSFFFSWVR